MSHHRSRHVVLAVAAAGLAACSGDSSTNLYSCNNPGGGASVAVIVTAFDLSTSSSIVDSASGTLVGMVSTDSLRPEPDGSGKVAFLWGSGGAATYTVNVSRPGFLPWTQSNVIVPADHCGSAITQRLTALMQPVP